MSMDVELSVSSGGRGMKGGVSENEEVDEKWMSLGLADTYVVPVARTDKARTIMRQNETRRQSESQGQMSRWQITQT